jgi:hypothetical protein
MNPKTHKEILEEIASQGAREKIHNHARDLIWDVTHGFDGWSVGATTSGLVKRCNIAKENLDKIMDTVKELNRRDGQST